MKNIESSQGLTKNSRVDVRKRNLDISKPLTVVKTKDELKNIPGNFYDDHRDEEVLELYKQKKIEILIPEIKTVDASAAAANSVSAPSAAGNEENKVSAQESKSAEQAEPTAVSKLASNEESASTTASARHQDTSANSSKQSPAKAEQNGVKAAPPVPAFTASATVPTTQNAQSAAPIDSLFKYKPLFKMPQFYIKHKENVYEGYENFSFNELNYEITNRDIRFLERSISDGSLNLTQHEFEKIIDIWEKNCYLGESQSKDNLVKKFQLIAPKEYVDKIPTAALEYIYQKYWKDEREQRKRSFMRMFWEKADYDDNDPFSAFRKRQKEKMKLRKKTKYEIESYKKMFEIRKSCLRVLDIMQDTYTREQIKRRQNLVDQAVFELQFEQMLKDRALTGQIQLPKLPQQKQQELRLIERGQEDYKQLEIEIDIQRTYNQMFFKHFTPPSSPHPLAPPPPMVQPQSQALSQVPSQTQGTLQQKTRRQDREDQKRANQQVLDSQDASIASSNASTAIMNKKGIDGIPQSGIKGQKGLKNQLILNDDSSSIRKDKDDRTAEPSSMADMTMDDMRQAPEDFKINLPVRSQMIPQPQKMPTEALCNFDMITSITKLLQEQKNLGVNCWEPRKLGFGFKSEKRYRDTAEETFQKPKENSKINEEEYGTGSLFPDDVVASGDSTYASSSKKSSDIIQIENEYESMMQCSLVLRRGRCGRYFAKYVQKQIFEDSEGSDQEGDIDAAEKKVLKKRRKRYQDLFEYLDIYKNANGPNNEQSYQGLLMRDKKYLRKKMTKIAQLSVKEHANKILNKNKELMRNAMMQQHHAVPQPFGSDILKLDYQQSVSSLVQDLGTSATNSGIPDNQNQSPPTFYENDDEGLRKYTKKVYSNIIDVVESIIPEGSEAASNEDKQVEEMKGYHQKQMNTWKISMTQSRLRGGGAAMQHNFYNPQSMNQGNSLQQQNPGMQRQFSLNMESGGAGQSSQNFHLQNSTSVYNINSNSGVPGNVGSMSYAGGRVNDYQNGSYRGTINANSNTINQNGGHPQHYSSTTANTLS